MKDKIIYPMPEIGEIKPMYFECKFSVRSDEGIGGDFEKNIGGTRKQRRIDFEGYAPESMLGMLASAIERITE